MSAPGSTRSRVLVKSSVKRGQTKGRFIRMTPAQLPSVCVEVQHDGTKFIADHVHIWGSHLVPIETFEQAEASVRTDRHCLRDPAFIYSKKLLISYISENPRLSAVMDDWHR
jgi:hypothetical protein